MFKKSFTIILISTLLTLSISATAENGALTKYKPFSEVIRESISTDIYNIGYGMILFSETYNPIAANLDDEDLQLVLDAYKEIDGERIEAPYNDTMFPSCYDEQNTDEYFFIGLSEKLPNERWTWNNTKMTALFFGGGQNGDVMYGSFGRKNSEYGEDYPKPVSSYFIWYRPHDEGQERITEIGKYIYDKYKPIAKPFGDYEGTQDDNLFNGYDGVWQTMFYLPDCLNTNGSSDWAEYTLQLAALEGLYTYEQASNYTAPITRLEFCNLIAHLLNKIPKRNIEDYYKNQYGYTVLENKVSELGLSDIAENISYNDIPIMSDDVKYVSAVGLMQGVGNGDFDPDSYLTREQICAVFDRMFELYDNYERYRVADNEIGADKFNDDEEISDWANSSVHKMQKSGFVSGYDNNYFIPKDYCTKEQAISIIYRVLQGCTF
ncbi:MAG: S-layer homology domain-containing protein [Clostridia bacterium]|nr:S-layer homology domain-containing protein [Clostridia bacterium]